MPVTTPPFATVDFVFVCPVSNKVFNCPDFRVIDNRGVCADADGERRLDAKVVLDSACPFCGKKHVYHAAELPCPFTGGSGDGISGKGWQP